jgi:hypothetical protein
MGLAPYAYPLPPSPRDRELAAAPTGWRDVLLRVDALYLIAASVAAFALKAMGTRVAGVGFGEAHELALIAGLLLASASPRRCWHLAAAGVHALLAAANLAHWGTLVADGTAAAGLATVLHAVFVALNAAAARSAETRPR